jgi:hypothetical protein
MLHCAILLLHHNISFGSCQLYKRFQRKARHPRVRGVGIGHIGVIAGRRDQEYAGNPAEQATEYMILSIEQQAEQLRIGKAVRRFKMVVPTGIEPVSPA